MKEEDFKKILSKENTDEKAKTFESIRFIIDQLNRFEKDIKDKFQEDEKKKIYKNLEFLFNNKMITAEKVVDVKKIFEENKESFEKGENNLEKIDEEIGKAKVFFIGILYKLRKSENKTL